MTQQEMIDRFGENNARIMMQRAEQHQAGLEMMCVPDLSRRPHVVGPARQTLTKPHTGTEFGPFMDRMKKIEEEFMSGVRKRIYVDTFEV